MKLEFDVTIELTLTKKEFDFLDKYMQLQAQARGEYRGAIEQGGFWYGNCNRLKLSDDINNTFFRFKIRDINGPVFKALDCNFVAEEDREDACKLFLLFFNVWNIAEEKCGSLNNVQIE